MLRYLTVAALTLAALHTHAQERPAVPVSPLPANADTRVPEIEYDSAFTGYQPFREQKLAPWRELNDEAHKAGGHIGIFGGTRAAPAQHPPEHKK